MSCHTDDTGVGVAQVNSAANEIITAMIEGNSWNTFTNYNEITITVFGTEYYRATLYYIEIH